MESFGAKLNLKKVFCVILKTILYLSLLLVFFHYYLKDQMTAFMKRRTTKTVREETATILEFPTTTICFQTSTKISVSKKYGFKDNDDVFTQDVGNQSLAFTFDSLGFQYDMDFTMQDSIYGEMLRIGENSIPSFHTAWVTKKDRNQTFKFDLQPVRTYSSGTCYKLEPKFDVQADLIPMRFRIKVILDQSLKPMDRPEFIILYFTSNKTDVIVTDNVIMQFPISHVKIPFKSELTRIYLKVVEKLFGHGQDDSSECLKSAYLAHAEAKCQVACDLLSTTDLPLCQKAEDLQCIWDGYKEDCLMVKQGTTYKILTHVTDSYHDDLNSSMTEIIFGLWTMQKSIEEDVPVLTLQDLIGSVGGSLGMFFGFSLSATIIAIVRRVFQ